MNGNLQQVKLEEYSPHATRARNGVQGQTAKKLKDVRTVVTLGGNVWPRGRPRQSFRSFFIVPVCGGLFFAFLSLTRQFPFAFDCTVYFHVGNRGESAIDQTRGAVDRGRVRKGIFLRFRVATDCPALGGGILSYLSRRIGDSRESQLAQNGHDRLSVLAAFRDSRLYGVQRTGAQRYVDQATAGLSTSRATSADCGGDAFRVPCAPLLLS